MNVLESFPKFISSYDRSVGFRLLSYKTYFSIAAAMTKIQTKELHAKAHSYVPVAERSAAAT